MIQLTYDELAEVCDHAGIDPEDIRTDYSGRGMYGARCFGIVGGISTLVQFVAEGASRLDGWEWMPGVREDSMGLSAIYYWPGVEVTDVPEDR